MISIIIPVYNVEKYIGECLDSVLHQTYSDIEIVAIDDCGQDDSMSIVEEYASKEPRIRIIRQENNVGPMVAREVGYNAAKGEYIFFCDSDDTLPNHALESLYNEAVKTGADIVIGNMNSMEPDGSIRLWKKEQLKYGVDKVSVYKSLLEGHISHNLCAKLFRKEILTGYNYTTIPNMRNGEDAMLFYQIVENCEKVVCVDVPVYNYIQHSSSSTHIKVSDENVEKLIVWRCFLYNNIVKKYADIETLGYIATVRVISSIWYQYPYFSRKRFVGILKQNNIQSLFSMKRLYQQLGFRGLYDIYILTMIKYLYHNIKTYL